MINKILSLLCCCCFAVVAFGQTPKIKEDSTFWDDGQYGIVKDTDGYVNVRSEATTRSSIIDTLASGRLIYCEGGGSDGSENWLSVNFKKNGKMYYGYINRSRIQLIDELTAFTRVKSTDSLLVLKFDTISIVIKTGIITGSKKVLAIKNGQLYTGHKIGWGTDGGIPRTQYKQIRIKTGSKENIVPRKLYDNLFEPDLLRTDAYIDSAGKVYLVAYNSDGGAVYDLVWVIVNGHIIDEAVGLDPED